MNDYTYRKERLATKAALYIICAAACTLLSITQAAHAQQSTVQPLPPPVAIGDSTNAWLALQRSNREAAPMQPMLGAEAGLAYQRYLDSFKTKIPASFTSATDGGNAANQLHVDYTNGNGAQN